MVNSRILSLWDDDFSPNDRASLEVETVSLHEGVRGNADAEGGVLPLKDGEGVTTRDGNCQSAGEERRIVVEWVFRIGGEVEELLVRCFHSISRTVFSRELPSRPVPSAIRAEIRSTWSSSRTDSSRSNRRPSGCSG